MRQIVPMSWVPTYCDQLFVHCRPGFHLTVPVAYWDSLKIVAGLNWLMGSQPFSSFLSKFYNQICSGHDIAKMYLKLALNTNQSINQLFSKVYTGTTVSRPVIVNDTSFS